MTDTPDGTGDDEASRYETDLLALADLSVDTTGSVDDPRPALDTVPDPVLEAELAGFAALLAGHRTNPDASSTGCDTEPGTRDDDAQDDDAQAAS